LLEQDQVQAVVASTDVDNLASRRVLEKNGFLLSGFDNHGQALYRRDG